MIIFGGLGSTNPLPNYTRGHQETWNGFSISLRSQDPKRGILPKGTNKTQGMSWGDGGQQRLWAHHHGGSENLAPCRYDQRSDASKCTP